MLTLTNLLDNGGMWPASQSDGLSEDWSRASAGLIAAGTGTSVELRLAIDVITMVVSVISADKVTSSGVETSELLRVAAGTKTDSFI